MSEFHARISRVRMKSGGADIRIIEGTPYRDDMMDIRGDIAQAAREIAETVSDLQGFVIIAIDGNGDDYTATRVLSDCPIPIPLMPAYVAELVRQSMLTKPSARNLFDDMFQWVE